MPMKLFVKENIIWVFVWLLLVYINGLGDFFNTGLSFWQRFFEPMVWGTLVFAAVYFAWGERRRPVIQGKILPKKIALLMLMMPVVILVLYALEKINIILFLVSAMAWLLTAKMLLQPRQKNVPGTK